MASIIHISLGRFGGVTANGTGLNVPSGITATASEEITSSGASQATTISVPTTHEPDTYCWRIANTGTDFHYAHFAAAPVALVTGAVGHGIPANSVNYFPATAAAEKVAIIIQS